MAGNDQNNDTTELANELDQLMQELAGDDQDAEPTAAQPNSTDHETSLASLQASIAALGAELRQADARLAQLLQAGQVEIMELLVRSEQSMRSDLLLVEERVRADIAKLHGQLQTRDLGHPPENHSDDSQTTNTDK